MDFLNQFGFGGVPAGFRGARRPFERTLKCYSIMMLTGKAREDANAGGKIFLPPDALEQLAQLEVQYPMQFQLTNEAADKVTHAGVLEFIAEPGRVYLPAWMMRNLLLEEGGLITVRNISLQTCTYAKFQAQSVDFLDITDPKAVLENTLRSFSCLTQNDVIAINYNKKIYEIEVLEVRPCDASRCVSIVECDMELEFAAPVGYKEPVRQPVAQPEAAAEAKPEAEPPKMTFFGTGHRLDGKTIKGADSNKVFGGEAPKQEFQKALGKDDQQLRRAQQAAAAQARIKAFTPGKLSFGKATPTPAVSQGEQADKPPKKTFGGSGKALGRSK
eukprot:TRINITY_DN10319_c0_g1_i5.p1 TRINITY_DN10319_c0_g1~~TRINITY_DN10319_c0_g1_i5.p1  ORF type:complete len:330 (+),score=78.70 TRINITY_DN10319_c0_g1_i5:140-1129(+)